MTRRFAAVMIATTALLPATASATSAGSQKTVVPTKAERAGSSVATTHRRSRLQPGPASCRYEKCLTCLRLVALHLMPTDATPNVADGSPHDRTRYVTDYAAHGQTKPRGSHVPHVPREPSINLGQHFFGPPGDHDLRGAARARIDRRARDLNERDAGDECRGARRRRGRGLDESRRRDMRRGT
jgi:hypothetical protein